jgi:hypothetical protein
MKFNIWQMSTLAQASITQEKSRINYKKIIPTQKILLSNIENRIRKEVNQPCLTLVPIIQSQPCLPVLENCS